MTDNVYARMSQELNENFKLEAIYSVNEIIDFFKSKGMSPGVIKDFIFYLIIKDFFKIIDYNKDILQSKILFQKKIALAIRSKMDGSATPLVISIPPFNEFGFESALKKNKIKCITIKEKLVELIKAATSAIDICSPFMELYKLEDMEDLLISKLAEGVTVRIITRELSNAHSERHNQFQAFLNKIKSLGLHNKIQIKDYHSSNKGIVLSSTHAKFLIIDRRIAYLGSGEIRYNSFNKNFELGIILDDRHIVGDISVIFEIIFSKSKVPSW